MQALPDFAAGIAQLPTMYQLEPRPCVLACKGCLEVWTHSTGPGHSGRRNKYLVTCSICLASYHL